LSVQEKLARGAAGRKIAAMQKAPLLSAAICWLAASLPVAATDPQIAAGVDISRWRGFNLLEKFTLRRSAPFNEDDFRWIAELGFNFVRLPMDYRCYTEPDDWLKFREAALREIDQAVEFGARHRIHVCLNLHRAPGFCINPPAEPTNLWTDEAALDAFVAHWTMFARRYRDVPPDRLSFNLLNEPTRNTRANYLKVNLRAIEAIRQVDPRRLIIVDGNNVGKESSPEFLPYPTVVQATRGYHPGTISHYRASWVQGSDKYPEPQWPLWRVPGHFYGPSKPELRSPLVLRGDLRPGTEIALKVGQLSGKAKLQARVDGRVVAERLCDPRQQPAAWRPAKMDAEWPRHEPVGELRFTVALAQAARELAIENVEGDWVRCSELTVRLPDGARQIVAMDSEWGRRQSTVEVAADGRVQPPAGVSPDQILIDYLKPWRDISARGAPVFVGEWGCFNKTPHPVALAWMKAWLEQWKQARFGWALWNFRGSFGVLDSDRADVRYEDWHGHKLDRAMLALLQRYQQY
jgi:aryl-phospho-beta-D-glucosidase BglC (GH1 family)